MSTKYFGSWSSYDEMRASWVDSVYNRETGQREEEVLADFPPDEAILFASYGGAAYEGDAVVIFERDGTLYENQGGHCSCNGLEGQWSPEATTWAALAMRTRAGTVRYPYLEDHDEDARTAYWTLVDSRIAPATPNEPARTP